MAKVVDRWDSGAHSSVPPGSTSFNSVIVLLCGWAGSQEKHLLVYESLFRRVALAIHPTLNVLSLRCSLPLRLIFSPFASSRETWVVDNVIHPLEQAVSSCKEGSGRCWVLLYAFSNGGGYVVEQVYKMLVADNIGSIVRGIVFDSAPCFDAGDMGKRVLEEVVGRGTWYRRAGIAILDAAQKLGAHTFARNRHRDYWETMSDIGGWCPTLHLYSMDDPLCDADKLYELIMAKLHRGFDVSRRCWDISIHCAHYKEHTSEYEEALTYFLRRVLSTSEQTEHRTGRKPSRMYFPVVRRPAKL
jgi:hypothetical protein